MDIEWGSAFSYIYILILIAVGIRIVYDTKDPSDAFGYLLLILYLPVVGLLLYLAVGINHRKRKIYSRKMINNAELKEQLGERISRHTEFILNKNEAYFTEKNKLAKLLLSEIDSPLTADNKVVLLNNGENKFPAVLEALDKAENHIHIGYYTFEDDETGRQIEEILVKKAKQGVKVRLMYDDFGSRSIRGKMRKRLQAVGASIYPFYEINIATFLTRLNYRNHRKIIIIDGKTSFVGGINVSNAYVNKEEGSQMYWRDTHLQIEGSAVHYLQYIFMSDWNFCAEEKIEVEDILFPSFEEKSAGNKIVQIAASGPDSDSATILHSLIQAINIAKKEILITTPYFIPSDSIMKAIMIASCSGIKVKLIVPKSSDSRIVDAAAMSYFGDLLDAGVEVYRYTKGFIHAKTMVIDEEIGIVGSANMDTRSFSLNFEVNAIVYNDDLACEMKETFYDDLAQTVRLTKQEWEKRSAAVQFLHRLARLFSPIL